MIREEIAKNVFFTFFEGNYKKMRLSINLISPLKRETLTETALLPYLLERGCEKFPDMTAIKRQLNILYGASMQVSTSSVDFMRVLSLTIDGVDEKYLNEKDIEQKRTDLLLDILFNPVIKNNSFNDEWVDIEREKLKLLIMSEINDKRAYCLKKAGELFFLNDVRALPQNGFLEDLDGIDGSRLYEVYKETMSISTVEIIAIGGDNEVKFKLAQAFSNIERNTKEIPEKKAVPYMPERSEKIVFDVEQDKFAMILTAGRLLTDFEQSVFRLANVILGSSPTSRLFMNVREKQSLCYYCASRPGYLSGALTIDSGIERENVTKLKDAVLFEIEDLKNENISDKELTEAKLMLESALLSVEDSVEGVGGWYLNSMFRLGSAITPKEEIQRISVVSKKDIASLMALFKVNVEVLLSGDK